MEWRLAANAWRSGGVELLLLHAYVEAVQCALQWVVTVVSRRSQNMSVASVQGGR
jgi:hypothetical protein